MSKTLSTKQLDRLEAKWMRILAEQHPTFIKLLKKDIRGGQRLTIKANKIYHET